MVSLLLFLIPIFFTFRLLKYYWISNEILAAQYKIDALKDRLYWAVIDNQIHTDDEAYIYLEQSLTVAPVVIEKLNFWTILYLIYKHKSNFPENKIDALRSRIENTDFLNDIFEEYKKTLHTIIFKKSAISIILFRPVWTSVLRSVVTKTKEPDTCRHHEYKYSEIEQEYSNRIAFLPETSAVNLSI